MSISERATHVLSVMLIVVSASAATGWASIEPTTHCNQQTNSCTPEASLTCCCPTAPTPIDRTQRPQLAPPSAHMSTTSLMDDILPTAPSLAWTDVTSAHWLRNLDLGLLHRAFLI